MKVEVHDFEESEPTQSVGVLNDRHAYYFRYYKGQACLYVSTNLEVQYGIHGDHLYAETSIEYGTTEDSTVTFEEFEELMRVLTFNAMTTARLETEAIEEMASL